MNIKDIIRAWKDGSYRDSLSEEQRALLPENPIGEALSEEDLRSVSGGKIDDSQANGPGASACVSQHDNYTCPVGCEV